jgi:5'(3')-deoxyribonucleotidase
VPPIKTIYVDMDDVLCETARGCLEIVERVFGKRIAYEQLTDFNLGNACELSSEETAELYHIVHHPDELLRLKPVNGAIAVLNQWMAAGFEIAIVTRRHPATYEQSLDWLVRERVPYQSFTLVINTDGLQPRKRLPSLCRNWLGNSPLE